MCRFGSGKTFPTSLSHLSKKGYSESSQLTVEPLTLMSQEQQPVVKLYPSIGARSCYSSRRLKRTSLLFWPPKAVLQDAREPLAGQNVWM